MAERDSDRYRSKVIPILMLMICSLALAACLIQGEQLLWTDRLGAAGWAVYRLTFWLVAPLRLPLMALVPEKDHTWTPLHYVLLTGGLPFYLGALWWAGRSAASRVKGDGMLKKWKKARGKKFLKINKSATGNSESITITSTSPKITPEGVTPNNPQSPIPNPQSPIPNPHSPIRNPRTPRFTPS